MNLTDEQKAIADTLLSKADDKEGWKQFRQWTQGLTNHGRDQEMSAALIGHLIGRLDEGEADGNMPLVGRYQQAVLRELNIRVSAPWSWSDLNAAEGAIMQVIDGYTLKGIHEKRLEEIRHHLGKLLVGAACHKDDAKGGRQIAALVTVGHYIAHEYRIKACEEAAGRGQYNCLKRLVDTYLTEFSGNEVHGIVQRMIKGGQQRYLGNLLVAAASHQDGQAGSKMIAALVGVSRYIAHEYRVLACHEAAELGRDSCIKPLLDAYHAELSDDELTQLLQRATKGGQRITVKNMSGRLEARLSGFSNEQFGKITVCAVEHGEMGILGDFHKAFKEQTEATYPAMSDAVIKSGNIEYLTAFEKEFSKLELRIKKNPGEQGSFYRAKFMSIARHGQQAMLAHYVAVYQADKGSNFHYEPSASSYQSYSYDSDAHKAQSIINDTDCHHILAEAMSFGQMEMMQEIKTLARRYNLFATENKINEEVFSTAIIKAIEEKRAMAIGPTLAAFDEPPTGNFRTPSVCTKVLIHAARFGRDDVMGDMLAALPDYGGWLATQQEDHQKIMLNLTYHGDVALISKYRATLPNPDNVDSKDYYIKMIGYAAFRGNVAAMQHWRDAAHNQHNQAIVFDRADITTVLKSAAGNMIVSDIPVPIQMELGNHLEVMNAVITDMIAGREVLRPNHEDVLNMIQGMPIGSIKRANEALLNRWPHDTVPFKDLVALTHTIACNPDATQQLQELRKQFSREIAAVPVRTVATGLHKDTSLPAMLIFAKQITQLINMPVRTANAHLQTLHPTINDRHCAMFLPYALAALPAAQQQNALNQLLLSRNPDHSIEDGEVVSISNYYYPGALFPTRTVDKIDRIGDHSDYVLVKDIIREAEIIRQLAGKDNVFSPHLPEAVQQFKQDQTLRDMTHALRLCRRFPYFNDPLQLRLTQAPLQKVYEFLSPHSDRLKQVVGAGCYR